MLRRAGEPIKAPHHNRIELPLPSVIPPQFSTSVLLTHAAIVVYIWQHSEDAHEHLPSPGSSEAPEGHQYENRVFFCRTCTASGGCVFGERSRKEKVSG